MASYATQVTALLAEAWLQSEPLSIELSKDMLDRLGTAVARNHDGLHGRV